MSNAHFIQPALIEKDTPELRSKLEDIGYIRYSEEESKGEVVKYLYTFLSLYNTTTNPYSTDIVGEACIHCGDNEELFLALAALNSSTDYMQWFTDGKNWYKHTIDGSVIELGKRIYGYHKASVKELIEHFGDKLEDLPEVIQAKVRTFNIEHYNSKLCPSCRKYMLVDGMCYGCNYYKLKGT